MPLLLCLYNGQGKLAKSFTDCEKPKHLELRTEELLENTT